MHGKYSKYIALAQEAENSIQLGDMGFDYGLIRNELNPLFHRILGGNHDNYEEDNNGFRWQPPHFLGDFGTYSVPDIADFFFVRGGYSIDKMYRKEGLDWWPTEQISYADGMKALDFYSSLKPEFVITHECPVEVIDWVSANKTWNGDFIRPSMTAQLLQQMWQLHQPKFWFFGHHHNDWRKELNGTTFHCLNELSYVDLQKKEDK